VGIPETADGVWAPQSGRNEDETKDLYYVPKMPKIIVLKKKTLVVNHLKFIFLSKFPI
jgi:hypothetical protein